jgi:Zn-dependent protease
MEEKREATVYERRSFFSSLKKSVWINILLFALTIISTIVVGISLSASFKYIDVSAKNPRPPLDMQLVKNPQVIALGIIYAVVLMGILLGHELGHFLACRYYKINATLPYFIPAPTLIGTLGAFIRIKSPITRKHQLFDIGVAGPLTGFILSLPALIYGLSLSKLTLSISPEEGGIAFGESLLLKIFGHMIFKNVPPGHDLFLHPVALAGWVGILVTSFNLFPVGQLDGGHISYALLGSKSRKVANFFLVIFFVMGIFFWIGWFIWALIIVLLGLRHPSVLDEAVPLSPGRRIIALVMVLVFILSFIPDPIKGYDLLTLLRGIRF